MSRLALAALVPWLAQGCASYYVVKSDFERTDTRGVEPEVVRTSSFDRRLGSIRTLAVKAPDTCIDETASQSSGLSSSTGTVLKTSCGVEMALIERELAKAGYRVVSWKVLNNTSSGNGATSLAAAADLGAEALVQINSLERSSSLVGNSAVWTRSYFQSDAGGSVKGSRTLEEARADQLDFLAARGENLLVGDDLQRLSATINASITHVGTGQAIWFYEWTLAESDRSAIESSVHVRCKGEACAVAPPSRLDRGKPEARSSSTAVRVNRQRAADGLNARYHALLKSVVEDMVGRFSGA